MGWANQKAQPKTKKQIMHIDFFFHTIPFVICDKFITCDMS